MAEYNARISRRGAVSEGAGAQRESVVMDGGRRRSWEAEEAKIGEFACGVRGE